MSPDVLPTRHRIEHSQVVAPSDFKRFAELGIIASMQPSHAITDQRWADSRLGEYRVLGAYSWHLMRSYGVHVAVGTDFPVESIDPYRTLFRRRCTTGRKRQARRRMAAAGTALDGRGDRCHTYESAYADFAEKERHDRSRETRRPRRAFKRSTEDRTARDSDDLPVYVVFNGNLLQGERVNALPFADALIDTPPLVVTTRTGAPPPFRSAVILFSLQLSRSLSSLLILSPGTSLENPPFTVPVFDLRGVVFVPSKTHPAIWSFRH
ncbi:MAG: amidohydrolase family protein [Acidobacteria bacterium]|nr:amidohydrolase family protein [Acidobacteriota bacterium]